MLEINQYVRKPFTVNAIQVTEENLAEVAEWCGGEAFLEGRDTKTSHIVFKQSRGNNSRVVNEREIRVYVTEWITEKNGSFKVFPDWAFKKSFGEDHSLTVNEQRIAAGAVGVGMEGEGTFLIAGMEFVDAPRPESDVNAESVTAPEENA